MSDRHRDPRSRGLWDYHIAPSECTPAICNMVHFVRMGLNLSQIIDTLEGLENLLVDVDGSSAVSPFSGLYLFAW